MRPPVPFCASSDGVRPAFAVSGDGPPLVRAPHWFTHLEHDWTNPGMRPWGEDLSKRYRLLRFDQRGTDLSDRKVPEISLDAHVRDLEAVADAAGFDRFALLGLSQGAAIGVVYAVRHPERVSHLILCGGFVRGWADLPKDVAKRFDMDVELIRFGWDRADPSYRQVFSSQFMPDAPVEAIQSFNDHMRSTSSAETAAAIYTTLRNVDVRDAARQVQCPTLVLHGRGDMRVPFAEGRLIAGLIPGACFVTLETRNHLMMQDEPAWRAFLDAAAAFYPPARAVLAKNSFQTSPCASARCWS